MRKLSFWAKHHPVSARIIIIISHTLLVWIGIFLGTQLSLSGIRFSSSWIYFLIVLFLIVVACYPRIKSSKNYLKRKLCDFIVAGCSFFLTVCFTNMLDQPFTFYQTAGATIDVKPSPYKYEEAKRLLEQFEKGEKTKFTAKEKRFIKKEFKYQLLQYGKSKITGNKNKEAETLPILLVCIAAVGLFFLVGSLACGIACNGSGAAAWIVFIIGTAGIIWGAIAAIRAIKRKHSGTKAKSSP